MWRFKRPPTIVELTDVRTGRKEKIASVKEAARLLGYDPRTIWSWLKEDSPKLKGIVAKSNGQTYALRICMETVVRLRCLARTELSDVAEFYSLSKAASFLGMGKVQFYSLCHKWLRGERPVIVKGRLYSYEIEYCREISEAEDTTDGLIEICRRKKEAEKNHGGLSEHILEDADGAGEAKLEEEAGGPGCPDGQDEGGAGAQGDRGVPEEEGESLSCE